MPRATQKSFGAYLRKLRTRRELGTGEAASLSHRVAFDSRGAFSQPYLSQLESGRRIRVSFRKVACLAAIYAVPVQRIISRAPLSERERLNREYARMLAAHESLPAPLYRLPHTVAAIDAEIDEVLLGAAAPGVSLPLGQEGEARAILRKAATWARLPFFFQALPHREKLARDFWAGPHHAPPTSVRGYPSVLESMWREVATAFHDWLIYDRKTWRELLSNIKSWTIDFSRAGYEPRDALFTCAFTTPAMQDIAGVSRVPIAALLELRAAQVAIAIDRATPPEEPRRAPPPPIESAAIHCLRALINSVYTLIHAQTGNLAIVGASLRRVCDDVPQLAAPADADDTAAAVAILLARALAPASPTSQIT